MPVNVAIIATHPIQYHVPWYRALSNQPGIHVKVYYGCRPGEEEQGTGFDVPFQWDIPMFDGYDWELFESRKHKPGIDGFFANVSKNIGKTLARDRPDVIILTGWQGFPLIQALFWSLYLRIPRIVRGESSGLKPRNFPVRMAHTILLNRYDAFLAIGNANRQFYENYGIGRNRIFQCPYFVDNNRMLEQVENVRPQRQSLRKNWKIPDSSLCFVYAGKLNRKKRIFDLLHAFRMAVNAVPGIYLLIAGTGELMAEAGQYVLKNNLPVTFAGFLNQTEITKAYAASDCIVLPSDYGETWGLVINEAMVCGLPAICSDRVGCHPDLIKDGTTGMLYPCGDIDALSARLIEIASHPDKARTMGNSARELVLNSYSVDRAVTGTLDAINFVINH